MASALYRDGNGAKSSCEKALRPPLLTSCRRGLLMGESRLDEHEPLAPCPLTLVHRARPMITSMASRQSAMAGLADVVDVRDICHFARRSHPARRWIGALRVHHEVARASGDATSGRTHASRRPGDGYRGSHETAVSPDTDCRARTPSSARSCSRRRNDHHASSDAPRPRSGRVASAGVRGLGSVAPSRGAGGIRPRGRRAMGDIRGHLAERLWHHR